MKILQISIEVNSGSVGRIAEQIGEKVISNGWESYITFARNHLPSKSFTLRIGNRLDIYNHVIQTRFFDNHCFSSNNATRKLIKHIEQINPSIIHLHHLHGYFINIEILFSFLKHKRIPVVWTFHDCWSFTGHCAYFEYVGCERWKHECHTCPQLSEYPKTLFFDRTRRNFRLKKDIFNGVENLTIVPVSNWLADLVKQSFLKTYPLQVIHNGIDIEKFQPKEDLFKVKSLYNLDGCFVILGVASTWDRRKGLEYFIELNKKISAEFKIVLVGVSEEQQRKLPKSITGILRTESVEDLADLYSVADVFVNPTLEDTFPTTNLEALACGTPIITFRTGGSVESVNNDTGYIVQKSNVFEILEKVLLIKENGKQSYIEKCRSRAIELYNKDKKFAEYIDLYERLLRDH